MESAAKKIVHFLKYHNGVPVVLLILFMGAGTAAAANPEVRAAVYEEERIVQSVDNSLILGVNVDTLDFDIRITEITEDDTNFYVTYEMDTIDVQDLAWDFITNKQTITVNKEVLRGRNLERYIGLEIVEIREAERARIAETQKIERSIGKRDAMAATVYSGLLGQFRAPKEEVIVRPSRKITSRSTLNNQNTEQKGSGEDTASPVITLKGSSPMYVQEGGVFSDPGVLITDNVTQNISPEITITFEDTQVDALDTSVRGEYEFTYLAIDAAGNASHVVRRVKVVEEDHWWFNQGEPVQLDGGGTDDKVEVPSEDQPTGTQDEEPATTTPETSSDTTAPSITLSGKASVTLSVGDSFVDSGATATDEVDGDLTEAITVQGSVDTDTPGTYSRTYSVEDAAGNVSTVERIVTVEEEVQESSQSTSTPPAEA